MLIRSILVPVDGSAVSEQVIPYARGLARVLDVPIELLEVVESPMEPDEGILMIPGSEQGMNPREIARDYLESLARPVRQTGLEVNVAVYEGAAGPRIVQRAASSPGVLIAMTTRGRSGITRWLMGSVTDEVLRTSASPMLVVRGRPELEYRGEAKFTSLAVSLDGSREAEVSLPYAVLIAKSADSPLDLVRVTQSAWEYRSRFEDRTIMTDRVFKKANEEATLYLGKVRDRVLEDGVKTAAIHVRNGDPADTLLNFAGEGIPTVEERIMGHQDKGADAVIEDRLLIMATHGRSGVQRMLIGSVTDKLVRHTDGCVLVVRAHA